MAFAVVISASDVERVSKSLLHINEETLGAASLAAVNAVTQRGYDESRRRILSGVNLTDAYLQQRMEIVPANDPSNPVAAIVALRTGGRRPALRPVTLRQYAPIQQQVATNFNNNDPRIKRRSMGFNPRKPGAFLPWKKRIGAKSLGITVGQKQAGITIEVVKGRRKLIKGAFFAAGRAGKVEGGQGLLIFTRKGNGGKGSGKGKLQARYSLSVWQMFKHQAPNVVPLIRADLKTSVADAVEAAIEKAFDQ